MKKTYGTILVLSTATFVLLTASLACWAVEEKEEKIWRDEGLRHRGGQFELTDKMVEHVMERLRETHPERAEELAKLREKKPEQFKAELREIMREQFGKRFREHRERIGGRGPGPEESSPFGERGGGFGGGRGMRDRDGERRERTVRWGERMGERYAEFLEWLGKNYPEEAEKLAELKEEEKPELHRRQLWLMWRRYRAIFEAAKENPKLVEVLKEDLELKKERDKLLRKIRAASKNEKEELVKELEEIVSSRFDLIVKRKQIKYEQLRKELEELKERVKKSEAEAGKWKDAKFKNENVKVRLEKLMSRTEEFKWD